MAEDATNEIITRLEAEIAEHEARLKKKRDALRLLRETLEPSGTKVSIVRKALEVLADAGQPMHLHHDLIPVLEKMGLKVNPGSLYTQLSKHVSVDRVGRAMFLVARKLPPPRS